MMLNHPSWLMWIGAGLMVLGIVLPFLMVLKIVESTFFLNFLAYIAQTLGLILGLIGVVLWRRGDRHGDKHGEDR